LYKQTFILQPKIHVMKTFFNSSPIIILMLVLLISACANAQSGQKTPAIGDAMPSFSLTGQNGKVFNSADYVGKTVLVIYFYPKDESMVCTKEACSFRDSFNDFTKAGAKVIGINGGTVASHKAFSDHYKLPFILLSDPGDKVYRLFGVKNKMFMTGRETFVIDLHGKIVYIHEAMLQGKEHADDALKFIRAAKNK
jgi:peroxiredoxin Q/BCP